MKNEAHHRPEETDFSEARGAGLAAILMFLQIALIGYLLYALYFLATGDNALSSLRPFRAGWQYFLPAAFAAAALYPTDPLTRVVGKFAAATGAIAWILFLAGAGVALSISDTHTSPKPSGGKEFVECLAGILWGTALGAASGLLFIMRLHRLRPAWARLDRIINATLLAKALAWAFTGYLAGCVAVYADDIIRGNYVQEASQILLFYTLGITSMAGLWGLAYLHRGDAITQDGERLGVFLCVLAGGAGVFAQFGKWYYIWYTVMCLASFFVLLNAGTEVIRGLRLHFLGSKDFTKKEP